MPLTARQREALRLMKKRKASAILTKHGFVHASDVRASNHSAGFVIAKLKPKTAKRLKLL